MLKKLLLLFICFFFSIPFSVKAVGIDEYADAFKIDLEKDTLPTLEEIKEFFFNQDTLYNTHYRSVFDLTGEFDAEFYQTISEYGMREKRLKWDDEEAILEVLNALPKDMYQYIGPMLFTIPNMSEKILNMPGIKETKNRFPTRIADAVKDIEDIEFVSPFLYHLLRPEVWGEVDENIEYPKPRRMHPKVIYDADFYKAVRKLVPPEKYNQDKSFSDKLERGDLRTISPTKNDLLTAADVQAFLNTLDSVEEWGKQNNRLYKIYQITMMWESFEMSKPDNKVPVAGLRDIVNPCQRLVQKATIIGEELSLAQVVAKQGFSLNEWAYTCDKTVKAYRLSQIPGYMVLAIRRYQKGLDDEEVKRLSPRMQKVRFVTMQAIIDMYKAPLNDVREVRKHRKALHDKWFKNDFKIVGTPVTGAD